jgi:hypothetical protein
MNLNTRFRVLLGLSQTFIAAIFGGVGVWQRSQILNQSLWGDQTLWNSTARFHVWPWPLKFAVITNLPAFFAGALLSVPIRLLWPEAPEAMDLAVLPLVFVLWYWLGARLERKAHSKMFLALFTAACIVGAFLPLGYVGYVPYGVTVWIVAAILIRD